MCRDALPGGTMAVADALQLNGVTLAFIGDTVYETLVRSYVIEKGEARIRDLHAAAVAHANAGAQAEAARRIAPALTETEAAVYRRARNAHTSHTPKNKTEAEYHSATGLEALFGFWYLTGQTGRMREMFCLAVRRDE